MLGKWSLLNVMLLGNYRNGNSSCAKE
uniref:Uncharacterized protein n=1 Tax=Rhizophora mucronata TaxID=61149 RepID=A0A2P2N1S3_RHIMU